MSYTHEFHDKSDIVPLVVSHGLFLKPISRINVSIQYPVLKQTHPNKDKSISSWELLEKLKALVAPDKFISCKVVMNTLEFVRFEGDLENKNVLKAVLARLEGRKLKLTGFKEPLKVTAAESKVPFPSKYDWDSFFRDSKVMNEMKPGERPDTIHFQNLPRSWFAKSPLEPLPSESIFRDVWETFGEVRCVDIPILDPYRQMLKSTGSGMKTFNFNNEPVFEGYVQFKDYMSFVKLMNALRGHFLVLNRNEKLLVSAIKVEFDKTKHMSADTIKKRNQERALLMEEEKEKKKALEEAEHEKKKKLKEQEEKKIKNFDRKIEMEERKYILASNKLEGIRLLDYVFSRLQMSSDTKKSGKGDDKSTSSRASDSSRSSSSSQSENGGSSDDEVNSNELSSPERRDHKDRDSSRKPHRRSCSPSVGRRYGSYENEKRDGSYRGQDYNRHDSRHERDPHSRRQGTSLSRSRSPHNFPVSFNKDERRGSGRSHRGRGTGFQKRTPIVHRSYYNVGASSSYQEPRDEDSHSFKSRLDRAYERYFERITKRSNLDASAKKDPSDSSDKDKESLEKCDDEAKEEKSLENEI